MTLKDILDGVTRTETGFASTIPANWLQGRTSYGGLSTALAYHCARLSVEEAPPLRSAQVAFVGPMNGDVEIRCDLLRRGRNTAFVEARILSADGVGFAGTFIFMNPRRSSIEFADIPAPDAGPVPSPEDIRHGPTEFFTSNMDYSGKRLVLGEGKPVLEGWQRITERSGLDSMTELLCIGDGLPPAAMGLMTEPGMVSSMNWQVNLLTAEPETVDGWWYLQSRAHHAHDGASSQHMTVWNQRLEPVMEATQSVALFV